MGQLVKPEQVAALVAYMPSPESGVMTGALVDYDQNIVGAYPGRLKYLLISRVIIPPRESRFLARSCDRSFPLVREAGSR
jgi:hypothetical protein